MTARELTQQAIGAMRERDWDRAEQRLAAAVRACPWDEEARRQYAEALWHRGDRRRAIGQMEQALQVATSPDPTALVRLGQMQWELLELEAAEERVRQALALAPGLAEAWRLLGDIKASRGDDQEALAAYLRSLSLHADDGVRIRVARMYLRQNEPRRALATLARLEPRVAELSEPASYWEVRGHALLALGRPTEAAEALAQAVQLATPSAQLLARLSEAQRQAGLAERAALARTTSTDSEAGIDR